MLRGIGGIDSPPGATALARPRYAATDSSAG